MKKRIIKWLLITAAIYLIAFVFFYNGTKGDVSKSLEYSSITTVALSVYFLIGPGDMARAKYNAQKYNTDLRTGAVIGQLEEQNRLLEEQNRKIEKQNRNKR